MATTLLAAELKQFKETLQKDRLIKVYVGKSNTPYLVKEAVLSKTSDVFARALKHEDHFGGEKGTLKFPEDDEEAWEVLLYWSVNNSLPTFPHAEDRLTCPLVHYWCLGEKYNIKEFQEIIMLQLIYNLKDFHIHVDAVKFTFENTPEGSPLRKLMARETIIKLYTYPSFTVDDLQVFDGMHGIFTELFKA